MVKFAGWRCGKTANRDNLIEHDVNFKATNMKLSAWIHTKAVNRGDARMSNIPGTVKGGKAAKYNWWVKVHMHIVARTRVLRSACSAPPLCACTDGIMAHAWQAPPTRANATAAAACANVDATDQSTCACMYICNRCQRQCRITAAGTATATGTCSPSTPATKWPTVKQTTETGVIQAACGSRRLTVGMQTPATS